MTTAASAAHVKAPRSIWRWHGFGLMSGFMIGIAVWWAWPVTSGPVAEFSCPPTGTAFVLSRPLAISQEPGFRSMVKITGHNGYDCHLLSQASGDYWHHAGLADTKSNVGWLAAAEQLWPLRVGAKTHAHFSENGSTYSVDYHVVAYEKFVARVGTYDAFKIIETLSEDGRLVFTVTRWWSPALKYTLSYRLVRTDDKGNRFWEIAEVVGRPA